MKSSVRTVLQKPAVSGKFGGLFFFTEVRLLQCANLLQHRLHVGCAWKILLRCQFVLGLWSNIGALNAQYAIAVGIRAHRALHSCRLLWAYSVLRDREREHIARALSSSTHADAARFIDEVSAVIGHIGYLLAAVILDCLLVGYASL